MFLKAILQKESRNQSFPEVSSEAGVNYADVLQNRFFRNFPIFAGKHLCWSPFLIKLKAYLNTCFLVNIAKFFDGKSLVASVDLLFLIKSNVRRFLRKGQILSQYALFKHIISRNHFSALLLINLQKQEKLVQNKPLQQRLFDLVFF